MIVIGIDPGLTGALAFIDTATGAVNIDEIPTRQRRTGGEVAKAVDGEALSTLVRQRVPADCAALSVCENVRSFGRSDAARGTAVDSLQRSLGAIEAIFDVLRMPCALVDPQAWQRLYGLKGKTKEKREHGALPAAIVTARQLYPAAAPLLARVKDHNRAEALLIAHYGRSTLA